MRKLFLSLILSLVVFVASAAGISNYKELLAFAKAVISDLIDKNIKRKVRRVLCEVASYGLFVVNKMRQGLVAFSFFRKR